MTSNRVTYTRRHSYRTKSNKFRIVKTPGGKNVAQYVTKTASHPKCGDCKTALIGVPRVRPTALARLSKRQKHVTRAYGGARCGSCVRTRIVRAFLVDEQKIVKSVVKSAP